LVNPKGEKMENNLKLSNQAMGAIMLALQESIMHQTDIVPILQNFELKDGNEGLVIMNPPTIRLDNTEVKETDLEKMVE
jgi:hypothetical protein